MKNIALIGFMGSGKTTLAKILAQELNYKLREIDEDIVHASGHTSVNDIFNLAGESRFRELEIDAITKVVKEQNLVISCGGGVVGSPKAMELLRQNAIIVFLHADFTTISQRLINTDTRPLFRDIEKATALYAQRLPLYQKYADIEVETDDKTPEEIAKAIIKLLSTYKSGIKTCIVIGDPIAHSLSPAMHNAAFKTLGIDKKYEFKAERVAPSELGKYVEEVRQKKIHMLAVTIPHKETIIQYLDRIDATAEEIGAVNIVINVNGNLVGYNTDCLGGMNALKKYTDLAGKKVLVLGSGGTAKAVVYGLTKEKATVTICGRNAEKVKELASKYSCKSIPWNERNQNNDFNIVINTTPVGREGEELPIKPGSIKPGQIVFDVNYSINGTALIKVAKEIGTTTIDGLELLLQQGALQFELYTGLKAPIEAMRNALKTPAHAGIS